MARIGLLTGGGDCPGIAGGADAILVPERPFDIEQVCAHLRRRHARGRSFSIVVVAEGCRKPPPSRLPPPQPPKRSGTRGSAGSA